MALLNNPQGQTVIVPISPNMELEFGFDPGSETQLSRDGDNLIFTFEDGGQIVLTDFYSQAVENLPTMNIQGAQIEAEDFLASLGDETLLPAAGPAAAQAATPDSGGSGAYADGAGGLIGGIDYLGTLGRDFWGGTTRTPLTDEGVLPADATETTPPSPGPGPDPEPEPENFIPSITGAPDNLTVHEDALPNGTKYNEPGHSATAEGSLDITSGDSLATIKIGGLTITILGVNPDGAVNFSVNGDSTVPYGDFTVTGITKKGDVYTVDYKYALTDAPLTHTEKNIDHESLPDKINIPVEAIDKDDDSTGEQSFTLDILDDNPETNSDWVTIDPAGTDTIYGNLNDGMWGTSKGEYPNSAAQSGFGDGAADNWGADGRVTKITDSEGKSYAVPKDGYVDVPTDSGTLRVYPNGDYEFTPNPGFADKTLVDFDNALHAKYDSKHSAEVQGYTLEAMIYDPATGEFTDADFHITNNVDRQIGVKHGDTVDDGHKNEISTYTDKSGKTVSEGVLITMPTDSTATSMSFSLTNFRDNMEQANWIIVYADGTVINGFSALSEFTIDFSSEHGSVKSVFIYANDDDKTSFFIDKMATHEAEQLPFKDTTFDYEVTDGDGDTSTSQLHIKGDEADAPMTKAAAMVPAAAGGPDDDQRHLLDDDTSGDIVRGTAHNDNLSGGDSDDTIAGEGGHDIIHGGLGNDILSGGGGDDIFVWTAGDRDPSGTPLVDTIKDFSMNNLAGKGDDQIDLRDLLSGATEDTLDNYLAISRVGDNAELHIYADGNPNGAATQVIVLENVYATHSGVDNDMDMNELIKQHVILNS